MENLMGDGQNFLLGTGLAVVIGFILLMIVTRTMAALIRWPIRLLVIGSLGYLGWGYLTGFGQHSWQTGLDKTIGRQVEAPAEKPVESAPPADVAREDEPVTRPVIVQPRTMAREAAPPTRGFQAEPPAQGSPPAAATREFSAPAEERAAPTIAASADGKFSSVSIFYGTDRKDESRKDAEPIKAVSFTGERAGRLQYGRAVVSVPNERKVGEVQRPRELNLLVFRVQLEKEDPNKHFTIREIGLLSREDFVAGARAQMAGSVTYKNQALVFVHGYNVTFDNALYRTAQVAFDLGFDGVPFLYSWPSAGALTEYIYDKDSSENSVRYLREFLTTVSKETGAETVHLIAHSMGNRALLNALREFNLQPQDQRPTNFNQIVLAAPDIAADVFANIADQIQGLGKGVTLYASSNDKALQLSASLAGGIVRAGEVGPAGPVLAAGVDSIDASGISTDALSTNHSTYAESAVLLGDIQRLITTGMRPPKVRTPELNEIAGGPQTFWRF